MTSKQPKTVTEQTLTRIINAVADAWGITPDDLFLPTRKQPYVFARQVCMALASIHTPLVLADIAQRFGRSDHTTVIHAKKVVAATMENDQSIKDIIKQIEQGLFPLVSS